MIQVLIQALLKAMRCQTNTYHVGLRYFSITENRFRAIYLGNGFNILNTHELNELEN